MSDFEMDDFIQGIFQPHDIEAWDNIIKSGIWKGDTGFMLDLFDQYMQLDKGHSVERQYGTSAYWKALADELSRIGLWDHDGDQRNQIGCGELEEEAVNEEEFPADYHYELDAMFRKSCMRFGTNYGQYNFR